MRLEVLLGAKVINIWQPNTKGIIVGVDLHYLPLVTVRSALGYDHKLPIQDLGFDDGRQPPHRVTDVVREIIS